MAKYPTDTKLILYVIGAFLLTYFFMFPQGWLVSDVYSYLNQGMAIAAGQDVLTYIDAVTQKVIPYSVTQYPLGNSFWIAFWIKLCGTYFVYLGSLASVLTSAFLLHKVLHKESFFTPAVLLLFLYPSLAFFSRSLMSSIPSILLITVFLYFLFKSKESHKKWFLLSFIAALSIWIRETNVVLLGSICLIHFFQHRRWFLSYAAGAISGTFPRLFTSNYYYGDPFYYVLGENFSILHVVDNLGVYTILLMCFMPLGLYFFVKYRGRYFLPVILSTTIYILVYLFYSFNATRYSGFSKGIILMGRFMIPLLPFYILSVGWFFRKKTLKGNLISSLYAVTIVVLISMQFLVHREAKTHKSISNHIYSTYSDKMVLTDLSRTTNVVRYINPFHGELSFLGDISNLKDNKYMDLLFDRFGEAYVIQTINSGNQKKQLNTSTINDYIKTAKTKYIVNEIEMIKIKPALELRVLKVGIREGIEGNSSGNDQKTRQKGGGLIQVDENRNKS
ncbi:MAG: hypothetical protein AAGA77_22780 [Bacteroidota bacterium]